ncbi:MAG: hypothetical protein ACNI3C_02475 [Candidatus Marinarcus sp.]|uniref:hypothetical protein n=1 Tax=Candidatus Marinarcus sp. TaxID=3100987 RepID=UPI003B005963
MDILILSLSHPILVGVYKDNKLIETYEKEGKSSDIIPIIFHQILKKYEVQRLFFVNAPGSYMAIKVAYVFLKSVSIVKNIELYATSGFHFNENSPIKALGKKYFLNDNGNIKIDFIDENLKLESFKLPEILDENIFSNDNLPQYNLPAV